MSALLEMLGQQLSGNNLQAISSQLGLDPAKTQQAIAHSLPGLLSGMAQHASSSPQAAQELHAAIEQAMPAQTMPAQGMTPQAATAANQNQAVATMPAPQTQATLPANLMQQLSNTQTVDQIAANTGLPASQIQQLLPMLAPMVMGAMGQVKQQQGLNAGGLAKMLKDTEAHIAQSAPQEAQKAMKFVGEHKGQLESAAMAGGAFLLGRLFSKH